MRAVLLAATLASCVPDWTRADTAREATALVLTAADWGQTRRIARDCWEDNPMIGTCGERLSPDAYFPLAMAVHLAIAWLLPHGAWRSGWQLLTVGAEGNQVVHNWIDGVSP